MPHNHTNTHAERQQLTGNLIKPAFNEVTSPKEKSGRKERDERRSKGGQGRED